MTDNENKPRDLGILWDRLVFSIKQSWEDKDESEYFYGVYEGLMWSLAELSVLMGRSKEYASLCKELDGIQWGGYGG